MLQKNTEYIFGNFENDLKNKLLNKRSILLIDENVFNIHEKKFSEFYKIIVPSGEKYKNQDTVNQIYNELISFEVDRTFNLIGIGGGVTTDITGFVASTYMRGLNFSFIPTTLLAQVDASIGGKNGIDIKEYKNLIGTINQPESIFFDIDFLTTLNNNEWINGFAEIIKHACIKDIELFNILNDNNLESLKNNKQFLKNIIDKNVSIKKNIIDNDPFEKGERKKLNFGHTLGHAIENNYNLYHGEAVSIGMIVAAKISCKINNLSIEEFNKIKNLINKYNLPIDYNYDLEKIFSTLKMDKKRNNNFINFILLNKIGEAIIKEIEFDTLYELLKK